MESTSQVSNHIFNLQIVEVNGLSLWADSCKDCGREDNKQSNKRILVRLLIKIKILE